MEMTPEALRVILDDHAKWLRGEDGGKQANLTSADLRSANLRSANLRSANLRSADLRYANLRYANLTYADLRSANLTSADLRYANLTYADLRSADLRSANLRYADLRSANLTSADLRYANLTYADLRSANLTSADLRYAENIPTLALAKTEILPREGEVIGWKKCNKNTLVKLRVPPESKRSNAFGRKCRAEFVEVLEVFGGEVGITDTHGPKTEYRVGQLTRCNEWDADRFVECGGGIHFFLTREEAEAY